MAVAEWIDAGDSVIAVMHIFSARKDQRCSGRATPVPCVDRAPGQVGAVGCLPRPFSGPQSRRDGGVQAMSAENLEIAKRGIDAFNRRDFDAYSDLFTPDFEWFPALGSAVEGGSSYSGREGMETFIGELRDTWEEFRVIAQRFADLFGNRVLVLVRVEGRGRRSSVPVTGRETVICDFRGDKVSRIRNYLDHGEALRAARLTESGQVPVSGVRPRSRGALRPIQQAARGVVQRSGYGRRGTPSPASS